MVFATGFPNILLLINKMNQVSLRGASAKEQTRDELFDRVAKERAICSLARQGASSALVIQVLHTSLLQLKRHLFILRGELRSLYLDCRGYGRVALLLEKLLLKHVQNGTSSLSHGMVKTTHELPQTQFLIKCCVLSL